MMQQNEPGTPKDQLRAMNVLGIALMTGIVIFLVIVLALVKWNDGGFGKDPGINIYFSIAAIVIAMICLVTAILGFKKRIASSPVQNIDLNSKLNYYRAAMILYMAACEGGALFSIIAIFLTGNFLLAIVVGVMVVAMYLKRPSKQRVIDDLGLNWEEQQKLET